MRNQHVCCMLISTTSEGCKLNLICYEANSKLYVIKTAHVSLDDLFMANNYANRIKLVFNSYCICINLNVKKMSSISIQKIMNNEITEYRNCR